MAQNNSAPAVVLRPAARRDLESIFAGFASRDPRRAQDFLMAAQKTLLQLGEMPRIGSPLDWTRFDPRLHSLRRWPVTSFSDQQIIYRPLVSDDGVVIFRVLHSAQDAPNRTAETLFDE